MQTQPCHKNDFIIYLKRNPNPNPNPKANPKSNPNPNSNISTITLLDKKMFILTLFQSNLSVFLIFIKQCDGTDDRLRVRVRVRVRLRVRVSFRKYHKMPSVLSQCFRNMTISKI